MKIIWSLPLLCVVLLLTGIGLCALQAFLTPATSINTRSTQEAYAALVTPADVSDTEVRDLMSGVNPALKHLAESMISESSQWVLLDDFSGLVQLPLHEYRERVLPLDPRNDGYAARLHEFFVRNENRIQFIPLHSVTPAYLQKQLTGLLEHIPYTLEIMGIARPLGLFFIIFSCAAVSLAFVRFLPFRPRLVVVEFFFCIPVLCALVFYGSVGFILIGLLAGIASLLRSPLEELSIALRGRAAHYGDGGAAHYGNRGASRLSDPSFLKQCRRDVYSPYMANWLISLLLIATYCTLSVISDASALFSIGILLLFVTAYGYAVFTWSRRGEQQRHIRFVPVLMIKPALNPLLMLVMLPFMLAAVAAGVSASAVPPGGAADAHNFISLQGNLVSEEEYLAHAAYQLSFSYRSLSAASMTEESFPSFSLARDSLIDPVFSAGSDIHSYEIPLFPLKNLMDFLAISRGDKDKKK